MSGRSDFTTLVLAARLCGLLDERGQDLPRFLLDEVPHQRPDGVVPAGVAVVLGPLPGDEGVGRVQEGNIFPSLGGSGL